MEKDALCNLSAQDFSRTRLSRAVWHPESGRRGSAASGHLTEPSLGDEVDRSHSMARPS
jgi:hypothetical protein